MSTMIPRFLLSRLSPGGPRGRLSILIYHRVLPKPDPLRPDDPDAAAFRWQMQLVSRFFQPLPLDDAVRRLREGCLPARAICVTFDDGYADNAEVAFPILQELRIPATFFIATGFLGGGRMFNDSVIETVRRLPNGKHNMAALGLGQHELTDDQSRIAAYSAIIRQVKYLPQHERDEYVQRMTQRLDAPLPDNLMMRHEQVRALHQAGMGIGGHTVSHPILSRLNDSAAVKEIRQGREELEYLIDAPVRLFAYPNGRPGKDYQAKHVAMIRDADFVAAVSTAVGTANRTSDVFQLPRFTPWDRSRMRFLARLVKNIGKVHERV